MRFGMRGDNPGEVLAEANLVTEVDEPLAKVSSGTSIDGGFLEGLEAGRQYEFHGSVGADGEDYVDRWRCLCGGSGGGAQCGGTEKKKGSEGGLHDGKLFRVS